jgi:hypothetical protein
MTPPETLPDDIAVRRTALMPNARHGSRRRPFLPGPLAYGLRPVGPRERGRKLLDQLALQLDGSERSQFSLVKSVSTRWE